MNAHQHSKNLHQPERQDYDALAVEGDRQMNASCAFYQKSHQIWQKSFHKQNSSVEKNMSKMLRVVKNNKVLSDKTIAL